MTDPRGRRGRIVPPKRATTRRHPAGTALQPPDPYRCWAHSRPDKFTCPECIENALEEDEL